MTILDIFSKRQKKARGEFPDVYVYDDVPSKLRVQIVHIIKDTLGQEDRYHGNRVTRLYDQIHRALCREYGKFNLVGDNYADSESIFNFFLQTQDHEQAIDVIELCFVVIDNAVRKNEYQWNIETRQSPDDAITELNHRFQEHGIGYSFDAGRIIRIDSSFSHAEIVKPTFRLLSEKNIFKGANNEFLSAHTHYRHAKYKECLNDCLKSFESVMKAICDARKWAYDKNATARKLIDTCLQNNLIPSYMQTQITSLRSILESGVPTVRNKMSGHGQGTTPTTVSRPLASFALHLTAANILFLAERHDELK